MDLNDRHKATGSYGAPSRRNEGRRGRVRLYFRAQGTAALLVTE